MEKDEITIPEELQQVCRELAEVAQRHGLYKLSGQFRGKGKWGGDVSFAWEAGRHNEDSDQLNITSTFNVWTQVRVAKI